MSLQKNFIYSSILTVSKYLFPLIVYPYVSRTLGLSNIGIINFVDNLVNYFVFFSMMGIATVGVREIAAARSSKTQLSKTFMSLYVAFVTDRHSDLHRHCRIVDSHVHRSETYRPSGPTLCRCCQATVQPISDGMVFYGHGRLQIHHQPFHFGQVLVCD